MKDHFYHGAIRKTIVAFLNTLNDIKIAKIDENGDNTKLVDVPLKLSPKEKYYAWLTRSHEKRMPSMGAAVTSLEYDSERAVGRFDKIKINTTEDKVEYVRTPAPYKISFKVHVVTKYISEADQIAEQIVSYYNPLVYTKIFMQPLDISFDVKITLDSIDINDDTDIGEEDLRAVEWVYNFTANTYVFKPKTNISNVRKVVQKLYLNKENFANRSVSTAMPSGIGDQDVEYLTLGSKEDDEIMIKYERFE
jgi:hypothetical protein